MDTFELIDILLKNSTFSKGQLLNSLKRYPLDKFTTKSILKNIFKEGGIKRPIKDSDEFLLFLLDESKNRKLKTAQNKKKRKVIKQKQDEFNARKKAKEEFELQKTYESINSQGVCNACDAKVNLNGNCKC